MRVAFTLIGGTHWTGGINYLENLLSALAEHGAGEVDAVLFTGQNADPLVLNRLKKFLRQPIVNSPVWNGGVWDVARRASKLVVQSDLLVDREFQRHGIDLAFQHQAWYGHLFRTPTLAWIADFQHRRLPHMFSLTRRLWRDVGYVGLSKVATRLMVSSSDAKQDCELYYPSSVGRIDVVPFAIRPSAFSATDEAATRSRYQLPPKFFFLPNQLWKHKNHVGVLEALRLLQARRGDIRIVCTGNASDVRHPDHPKTVLALAKKYALDEQFRYLGMIPLSDVHQLMTMAAAVINPSFFEGWSTTVEEAKACGVPLLLSDLPVHREQAPEKTAFFDPYDAYSISSTLMNCWDALPSMRDQSHAGAALLRYETDRAAFAARFILACGRTASHRV